MSRRQKQSRWGTVKPARRSATLRYYHRRKQQFLAAGLTVKGQPRKRAWKKYHTKAERRAAQRKWSYAGWLRRRAEYLAAGLTVNGTPRKNRQWPQLKGMATSDHSEYTRQTYHLRKAAKKRAGLAALVAGKNNLIAKLK